MVEPCGRLVLPGDGRIDPALGADIVAAVREAGRRGLVPPAVELALATWRVIAPARDRGWWRRLAEAGEDVAIAGRAPRGLIALLSSSGAAYARAGDPTTADDQWRRAFALAQRLGDHDHAAAALRRVGRLRRGTGALGRALTAFFELVRVRTDQGDDLGLVEALTEVGTTMQRAGRPGDAEYFLRRAWEALPADPPTPARHAAALVDLGRAWADRGAHATAVRCYSPALAALLDVDEAAAGEVRALLAAASRRTGAGPRRGAG